MLPIPSPSPSSPCRYPFRDIFDPETLRQQVVLWGATALSIGLFIHILDTLHKVAFGIAGEGLTRRLRTTTLRKLLHNEIGFYDSEENSVGEITSFLAKTVSLVQGLAQGGLQVRLAEID